MSTTYLNHHPAYDDTDIWDLLPNTNYDIGAGLGVSKLYPECAFVYNYEMYGGSGIYHNWVPIAEMKMSRLMAFAAAIRWDSEGGVHQNLEQSV